MHARARVRGYPFSRGVYVFPRDEHFTERRPRFSRRSFLMGFTKKNAAMLAIVLVAFVVFEGTGLSAAPKEFVAAVTAKVKSFFSGLFGTK